MASKILIAHDGSPCSAEAIADLARAGLPSRDVEAIVLTAAEFDSDVSLADQPQLSTYTPSILSEYADRAALAAAEIAEAGRQRVANLFPEWLVTAQTVTETPYWSIVKKAQEWNADLIVVGSHGRSMLERLMIGSISRKTLLYADCSVRISRCSGPESVAMGSRGVRILLAWDGSADAELAAEAICRRRWPSGSECRLVTALDYHLIRRLPGGIGDLIDRARTKADQFRSIGLASAEPIVLEGDPKRVLLDEAARWPADCIFIGTKGQSQISRVLLGSVSSAVATRAPCSIEVVRARQPAA